MDLHLNGNLILDYTVSPNTNDLKWQARTLEALMTHKSSLSEVLSARSSILSHSCWFLLSSLMFISKYLWKSVKCEEYIQPNRGIVFACYACEVSFDSCFICGERYDAFPFHMHSQLTFDLNHYPGMTPMKHLSRFSAVKHNV